MSNDPLVKQLREVVALAALCYEAADMIEELDAKLNKEMKMSDPIKVLEIEEHEDGSATVKLECDPKTFGAIFNVGFVSLVKTGLYWETNMESTND